MIPDVVLIHHNVRTSPMFVPVPARSGKPGINLTGMEATARGNNMDRRGAERRCICKDPHGGEG